ncbi:MAG: replicative DNA helicase [Candidatus Magasanikbacteria bacterium CG10_big_fil_rev_8_21_14_0_10_36_32]|uniref:Replicative DNA helicase n=1 Tax=Candidatus Magasanikbacteria bacterium CG10_big_fil_rev_8_21_14_0_10_36_32 TaxID=1974646 RepID=A0A2M6W5V8_9BACT|nr:MAG: replicative DNA helicase [Candidatus Magasanikbacteria bacterium CG10_big_fil_rev_8_21_14_0_10_36_32]
MTEQNQIEKIPPQSLEAEMSLLGSVLIDKDAMLKIADIVGPEDFYKTAHMKIFETIIELYERNEPIDLLTVSNRLEEKNNLEMIGGKSYLVTLTNTVPTSSNIANYAQIVHRKATRRRLLTASQEISRLGYEENDAIDNVLDEAQKHLFGVSQNYFKQGFTPIRGVLTDAFDRIDELHKNKGQLRGLATGFTALDKILTGLQKSDLVIIAARPSIGKTSLALDIIRHVGSKLKKPVGLFSLEMSKEQLVDRLLCAEANVDLWKLRSGQLSDRPEDNDFPRIGHAIGSLSEAPIYIDDSPSINIMQLRTKARRMQAEHGLSLIVIDYLQLMESRSSFDNRVQEVSEITRGLKGIARELNVPVLALSQLSRVVEQSKPAIPKLSHLRESGSIEQDADVVMFIYRKARDKNYSIEDIPPHERYIAEVHIEKHRNGPTGIVKLFFNEHCTSFRNLDNQIKDKIEAATPTSATVLKPKSAFTKYKTNENPNY